MKLKEIREAYEGLSGKLSSITRQLAFAGIGIIWIFRISDKEEIHSLPKECELPIVFLIICLGLDLLQYLYQSISWYWYYWHKRRKSVKEDDEVNEPEVLNIPAWSLLVFKVVALFLSYWYLLMYLYDRLLNC